MLTKVSDFYGKSFSEHQATPKGVGWKDKESQDIRFLQLCRVIAEGDSKEGISINDFGCGYGALFEYLEERVQIKKYYGYDICPDMITSAKKRNPYSKTEFIQSSRISHTADYSFASGTFTVQLDSTYKDWTDYIRSSLIKMSKKSKKGFAFNALSTYVDWKSKGTYYANPLFFFAFCKQNISKYVSLIHDYPLFEWTILVRKEGYLK